MSGASYEQANAVTRTQTGVVIPLFISDTMDPALAVGVIRDNVYAFCDVVTDAAHVCLSVDGNARGEEAAHQLSAEFGVQVICQSENRGKLSAATAGMRHLLQDDELRYLAVVDQDGDHFANELVTFTRTCRHVEHASGDDRVMVLGRRVSRHHPMGFGRGELEELADRVLLDALHYHASISGHPLRLEYATVQDEFPDFHSGFKLFTRATADAVFSGTEHKAGLDDDCYYRHAVEAVMTVESILSGAQFVQQSRTTINEQPISVFGSLDRAQLTADMILWPCMRLDVPANFVDQWLRNHIPRLLLHTLVPDGREMMQAIHRLVMHGYGATDLAALQAPPFV
ncbi:MAG: hypothetical protein O2923_00865 [Verrucomicrobia bacterium]|nr:hypothetical protein [Verrucomicrobiota bacterium]MDA1086115.1 hypothetical protein [Verrucomicrobiota bacterium]